MKDQPLLIGIKVSRNVKDQICSEVRMRDVSPKTLESRLNAARAIMRQDKIFSATERMDGCIKYLDEKGDYVVGTVVGTGTDKCRYREHYKLVGFDLIPLDRNMIEGLLGGAARAREYYLSMDSNTIVYYFGSWRIFSTVENNSATLAADALVRKRGRIFSIYNGYVKGWRVRKCQKD